MAIDLNNPAPLYRQIVADIKSKIVSGELKVDDRIGSHQELAKKYDVSLITVKKALADLINEGLLYSRIGKGTFVAGKSPFVIHSKHKTIGIVLNDLKSPFFHLSFTALKRTLTIPTSMWTGWDCRCIIIRRTSTLKVFILSNPSCQVAVGRIT